MLIGIWVGCSMGIFGVYELFFTSDFFGNYDIDSGIY